MYGGKKEKKVDNEDDQAKDKFKTFMGARVMWPPDVPDDILKSCIGKTSELFKTYEEDLAQKGNEVNLRFLFSPLGRRSAQKTPRRVGGRSLARLYGIKLWLLYGSRDETIPILLPGGICCTDI